MTGDDELFEELQRLVSPPSREPPPESVAALHASVARQFVPNTRRRWWQQKAAVGAALFGLVAGAPAAAFAIGGNPLPDPLRTAMHTIGLPVDSVPVADTKTAEADLEHALKNRDETEINKAAAHLQTCLAELDGTDRIRLAPHADALLLAATSDNADGQQTLRDSPDAHGSDANPSGDGGSSQPSGGSGDGDQATTVPTSPSPTTGATVPPTSGSGDGDRSATTTTVSRQGQSTNDATTTTVRSGGSSDGGGGSSSTDGGPSSDTATTTTTDPSH